MRILSILFLSVISFTCFAQLEKYESASKKKWEPAMAKFDNLNNSETYSEDAILFYGSSSIRLWSSIVADMAPFKVIQRGFGGSRYSDGAIFAERVIHPHKFKALVIFFGNDVVGKPSDAKPDEIKSFADIIVNKVRDKDKGVPIIFVAVTATQSRWGAWKAIQKSNDKLKQCADQNNAVYYLETNDYYLNDNGTPNNNLFKKDQLHQNKEGYAIWSSLIKAKLYSILTQ